MGYPFGGRACIDSGLFAGKSSFFKWTVPRPGSLDPPPQPCLFHVSQYHGAKIRGHDMEYFCNYNYNSYKSWTIRTSLGEDCYGGINAYWN